MGVARGDEFGLGHAPVVDGVVSAGGWGCEGVGAALWVSLGWVVNSRGRARDRLRCALQMCVGRQAAKARAAVWSSTMDPVVA